MAKSNMTIADQLGTLQAEILALQSQEKELKEEFKLEGVGAYEGDLYDVTVYDSERKNTAWRAIATKLGATAQMIAGNTTKSITTSVKCVARKVVR
jgi:D-serine deaminase-like pyridoxal phosphate-dependent protein